jgi:ParB family chromosome partitioning protein
VGPADGEPVYGGEESGAGLLLDAEDAAPPAGAGEIRVPLDRITANPDQPRKHFDEEALRELADSIREHGVIEPPIVEDAGDGTWVLIAGERRVRAARLAGLETVPVLVRVFTEAERMEVALIENIQRSDLNPVEEAAAYKRLMEISGLSQEEVAARVGKNRSTVTNTLRLLKLPDTMREALASGALSPGHGRALLSLGEGPEQEALFREITGGGLSVREAEKRASALAGEGRAEGAEKPAGPGGAGGSGKGGGPARDPELTRIEQRFIDTLGTKVSISGDLSRGSVRIDYYSMDDLDRLLGIMGGPP